MYVRLHARARVCIHTYITDVSACGCQARADSWDALRNLCVNTFVYICVWNEAVKEACFVYT